MASVTPATSMSHTRTLAESTTPDNIDSLLFLHHLDKPRPFPNVLYAKSPSAVRKDLRERFSVRNGPRIYQLQRANATHHQYSLFVATYYNAPKCYWDGLTTLTPIPICSYASSKDFSTYQQQSHFMQFLMGLNESYAHVRSQILFMDPLPSVGKAYSFVLQDESHKLIHAQSSAIDVAALQGSNATIDPMHLTATTSAE
uniref:Uncharacterized protein n=1 Tax=Nelumbo nucifera TaxID=4432 RepID=A0A822YR23_NELNU|nr:TPA_asm: hypothetical protein HUJ06_007285 [Nelumbo nucifera]